MNKSTLSLSLLAAVAAVAFGNAHAQTTVQIYGIAEAALTSVNDGTSKLGAGSGAKFDSKSMNGLNSRFGFRGTEDLGGGLKAKFELEQRFGVDTGATAGSQAFFGRSVVGLEGRLGEVLLGRNYSPAYHVALEADPFRHDSTVAQLGSAYTFAGYVGNGAGSAVRMDNSVTYNLPKLAPGLSVSVAVAGETATRQSGINAFYKTGPWNFGFAHDRRTSDTNLSIAMASYDFGFIKPVVSYSLAEAANAKTSNFSLGATAPFMGGTVKAAYANFNVEAFDITSQKFALGYEYGFSKRTSVFTDLGTAKTDRATRATGLDFGMRHRF